MSAQTKETSKPPAILEHPEREVPAYSTVFLSAMAEMAYDTLHDYLVAEGIKPEAVELLDNIILLLSIQRIFIQEGRVLYIFNQEAGELIAAMSKSIPALGGHFYTRQGELLKA